ncbi:hypothetical protein [Brevibacillus reuszeri]|uniref:hypothetical protein n=1 Tax=Brevibacillus reuszeri TaxID=54915 RepID=UPI000CCC1BF6|nr:hypothetical protein [Brevibacillus reuszeri]
MNKEITPLSGVNSFENINLDESIVFQSEQVIERDSEIARKLMSIGSTIRTVNVVINPKKESGQLMKSLVGAIPSSLLAQLESMQEIPSYVEEQSFVIIKKDDEKWLAQLCNEYDDIVLLSMTPEDVMQIREYKTFLQ